MNPVNPCLHCGACCAHFQVSFYWSEAQPHPGGWIPAEMVEEVNGLISCMIGTHQARPHCIALNGTVGRKVFCVIYEDRPQACRDFGIQWKNGRFCIRRTELDRCNKARRAWGLPTFRLPAHTPTRTPFPVQQRLHSRSNKVHRILITRPVLPQTRRGTSSGPGL